MLSINLLTHLFIYMLDVRQQLTTPHVRFGNVPRGKRGRILTVAQRPSNAIRCSFRRVRLRDIAFHTARAAKAIIE